MYGEAPGAGVGVAGETAINAPFAKTGAVPATGKQPQLNTTKSVVGAGVYVNPPETVPPVATCMPCACSTGDADGVGDCDGATLGDGLGPGPGRTEDPPPPHPATTAAPSAAATHAPMAICLLLMILFDSFNSYLPRRVKNVLAD